MKLLLMLVISVLILAGMYAFMGKNQEKLLQQVNTATDAAQQATDAYRAAQEKRMKEIAQ